MVEARVPVTTIQKLMGHARLHTTEIYLHISDKQVQADYEAAMEQIMERLSSAITVLKLANAYGTRSQKNIVPVTPLAISGMPIRRSFLKKHIVALAKTRERRTTWNAGIVLYVNGSPVMFAKPCHSRKLSTCIIL